MKKPLASRLLAETKLLSVHALKVQIAQLGKVCYCYHAVTHVYEAFRDVMGSDRSMRCRFILACGCGNTISWKDDREYYRAHIDSPRKQVIKCKQCKEKHTIKCFKKLHDLQGAASLHGMR